MAEVPDSTAVRTALWRARHTEVDLAPHVVDDVVGLRLIDPDPSWRDRPDMDPESTRGLRAAMVARARFVEDLVAEHADDGVGQYVLLGAGLDSFAQRHPEHPLRIFEIDQPATQEWKRRRLVETGESVPTMVPVDFEAGVSMYLTKDVTSAVLGRVAGLAAGSTLAMTFLLPAELLDEADRPVLRGSDDGARASGTPFVSFYAPEEMLALARAAGFADARHVPGAALDERYFADRSDGLHPARGEDFPVATT